MYLSDKYKYNHAQRAQKDPHFTDENATEGYITSPAGTKVRVTNYSDGSTTYHHGGPAGDSCYNENGDEC